MQQRGMLDKLISYNMVDFPFPVRLRYVLVAADKGLRFDGFSCGHPV